MGLNDLTVGGENTTKRTKERGLSKFSRFKEESKLQDDEEESDSANHQSHEESFVQAINVSYVEKEEHNDIMGGPIRFRFTEERATSSSKTHDHDAASLNMLEVGEVVKNARSEGQETSMCEN